MPKNRVQIFLNSQLFEAIKRAIEAQNDLGEFVFGSPSGVIRAAMRWKRNAPPGPLIQRPKGERKIHTVFLSPGLLEEYRLLPKRHGSEYVERVVRTFLTVGGSGKALAEFIPEEIIWGEKC